MRGGAMRGWVMLVLAATLAAVAGPAPANPLNELDAYVRRPDPAFGWTVDHPISGPGYRGAVLRMTSQSWLGPRRVDTPVWRHWLTVVVPDGVRHDKAFLYITGGDKTDPAPKGAADRFVKMALQTRSVVAELDDVPNQPLTFAETPGRARSEDGIIAYQQVKYARTHDPEDLVRLPMVKSGVAAMTAVQQYLTADHPDVPPVRGFVVSGGSKRAWTTWLVGAVDPRVAAIVPVVINVLDVEATTRHHWEAMGYFSPALKDYVENGLIPGMIGSKALADIDRIEDPLNYRDRPRMRMPKYVVNAVGDEYFPPDNTQFGYHLLPEVKRLRMIPNSRHSTAGTDISDSITAFYDAVLNGRPIPDYAWRFERDGTMVVTSKTQPLEVNLWRGTDPKARDFRVDTIGAAFTPTRLEAGADGAWRVHLKPPEAGWTAYFVELVYPSGVAGEPFKFTTEVYVTPDTLPYAWKDARPITAPPAR